MSSASGDQHGADGAALSLTWHGHATVLIEIDGTRLLTDPVLGSRAGPLLRHGRAVAADAGRAIDAVLLSHLHADHADTPSLRRVAAGLTVLAPVGAGAWLSARGIGEPRELAIGESASVGNLTVTATPAVHEGRRWRLGARAESIGFVAAGSQSCYFAGDTDLFPAMGDMRGTVDLALLPVSGWGPTLGPGHMDPERAARAAALLEPRVAVPIHWGTLGLPSRRLRPAEPSEPAREFERLARGLAPGVEVRVLMPGESTRLTAGAPR